MIHRRAFWVGLALILWTTGSALATVVQILDVKEMVSKSDVIVEGQVTAADSHWVRGHIQTTIRVQVTQQFKGKKTASELVLTQLGGTVKEPFPMGHAVPGLATFRPKEDVLLFLSTTPRIAPDELRKRANLPAGEPLPALWTSPATVGGHQGKYNIVTDAKTKKRMVARQAVACAQGLDPSQLSPELKAQLEQSVSHVHLKPSGMEQQLKSPASHSHPPLITSPSAPGNAVPYEEFILNLEQLVAEEKAAASASKSAKPVAAPDPPAAEASTTP